MSGATILFSDFVGFSKKATAEQRRLIDGLTSEVYYQLRTYMVPPLTYPSIVALPTGDGLAIVFLDDCNHDWRVALFKLIVRLMEWTVDEDSEQVSVQLRMGVHVGPVEIISDINGRPNVCGDTINYCQRVMDAANPGQVLFSESAYKHYIGSETGGVGLDLGKGRNLEVKCEGPVNVLAKHHLQIPVYKIIFESFPQLCSSDDPVAKNLMTVTLTPLPKEIIGSFSDRIESATEIAFIQLTGQRFLEKAMAGEVRFSDTLDRFWVFMPDPDTLGGAETLVNVEVLKQSLTGWKDLLSKLKQEHPRARIRLGMFREPPYFGASFINWRKPGGFIHVSPYIWGVQVQDCPGYDLEWVGIEPLVVYERYVAGLDYLADRCQEVPLG